jgi:hypothetical protein
MFLENPMSIREKLYLRIIGWMDSFRGYLNTYLHEYYVRKAVEYADEFLEKFRKDRPDPNNFSAQNKAPHHAGCTHLKGRGGWKQKYGSTSKDYNVHMHSFPDGKQKIWCGYGCGFVAWVGDSNWQAGLDMMKQSTNSPSSSERVLWAIGRPGQDTVYVDKDPTVTVQDKWGS